MIQLRRGQYSVSLPYRAAHCAVSGTIVPGKPLRRSSASRSVKYAQTGRIQEFLPASEFVGKAVVATNAAVPPLDRSVAPRQPRQNIEGGEVPNHDPYFRNHN